MGICLKGPLVSTRYRNDPNYGMAMVMLSGVNIFISMDYRTLGRRKKAHKPIALSQVWCLFPGTDEAG